MVEIVSALAEVGGVARTAQLARRGISRGDISRALRSGAILRLRQGVYALAATDPAVLTAARHGGEVACGAALKLRGVWILDDEPAASTGADAGSSSAHVWVGPSGREHAHAGCRCRSHHEIDDRRVGFGLVGVVLALLQYATCESEERFFAALESALRLGLLADSGLARLRARLPEAKRWLIDFASDQADSGLESLLRLRLHLCGISLRSQVLIPGLGTVDFLLEGRIILEADGRANHDSPGKRHKDLMRDAIAAAQGYETLRFDYAMIIFEWRRVLAAIEGRLDVLRSQDSDRTGSEVQEHADQM
jgi:very-short-patch-repair endonuclease